MDKVRELLGMDDDSEDEEDESPPTPTLDDDDDDDDAINDGGSVEGDVSQQIKGLESQINDLETETNTNQNRIESLQNDIDTVEDNLDQMEDNVRDLLGIYDAFSARVNPLVEGDIDSLPATSGNTADSEFDLTDGDEEPIGSESEGSGEDTSNDESDDESVRTLSDLKSETIETPDEGPPTTGSDNHHVYSVGGTYASEAVAYEWLSMLLRMSGTAGTLRALSYYHDIGWISADVKKALQRRLAGADFDEGDGEYRDLRADDHADSLAYVIKLEELEERAKR